ncbi:MAG: RDD family protein [Planctomycetota bacterium]
MDSPPQFRIETPETVAVTREVAGVGSRGVALAIDLLILSGVFSIVLLILAIAGSGVSTFILISITSAVLIVVPIPYFVITSLIFGASFGKKAMGLRVILDDGRPATAAAYFLRSLLLAIDVFIPVPPFSVGVISVFLTNDGKRLGDFLAGTVVVRDEGVLLEARDPFENRTYQQILQHEVELPIHAVRALTGRDLVVLREYFAREPEFSPAGRAHLQRELASRFSRILEVTQFTNDRAFLYELYLCLRDERSRA